MTLNGLKWTFISSPPCSQLQNMVHVIHYTVHLWNPTIIPPKFNNSKLTCKPLFYVFWFLVTIFKFHFPDVSTRKRKVFPATSARASNTTILICCKHSSSSNSHLERPAALLPPNLLVVVSSRNKSVPVQWWEKGVSCTGQLRVCRGKCMCRDDELFKYMPRLLEKSDDKCSLAMATMTSRWRQTITSKTLSCCCKLSSAVLLHLSTWIIITNTNIKNNP